MKTDRETVQKSESKKRSSKLNFAQDKKNKRTGPSVPRSETFNYETFEEKAISRMH